MRAPGRTNMVMLAGWLFADLLLGLAMLFLVANAFSIPSLPVPTITPTSTMPPVFPPTPTPIPLPTITPGPTPTPVPPTPTPFISLNHQPFTATIHTLPDALLASPSSATGQRERARLRGILRDLLEERCRVTHAGMVLIFGHAPDPAQGGRLANAVAQILQENEFVELCGAVVPREFHWIDPASANRGQIDIEIYFFNR